MRYEDYAAYVRAETMMGPNSVRILQELLEKHPPRLSPGEPILDLGCGTGLTSLVIARETGATVYAADLWIDPEDNAGRFRDWGIADRALPLRADANSLPFHEKQFPVLISVDSYHYFGAREGFFREKILPFLRDGGMALIGVPGVKDAYSRRAPELLADWLHDEVDMFQSPSAWKEIIGGGERVASVETWEMGCFEPAWGDWLSCDHEYARGDARFFERLIKPYTCFVGMCIKVR